MQTSKRRFTGTATFVSFLSVGGFFKHWKIIWIGTETYWLQSNFGVPQKLELILDYADAVNVVFYWRFHCSCREASGAPWLLHGRAEQFGLLRGGRVAAALEETCEGSRAASPSHGLPGQDPKAPPARGDATPAPSHPEGRGKQHRAIPNTGGYRHRSRTEGEAFIALLHWALPLATHMILTYDKWYCLRGRHAALCLRVLFPSISCAFFCYAKVKSKLWFMWGYSHCFA